MFEVSKYSALELRQTISDDAWAVRDEALKRNNAAGKKIEALRRKLAKLEAEAAEYGEIFQASLQQIAKEQGV